MTLRDLFRRRSARGRTRYVGRRWDGPRTRLGVERCEPRRVLAAVPGLDDSAIVAAQSDGDDTWHILETEAEVLEVDLSITITNGREIYETGGTARYTVIVTNDGPDAATGARVAVTLPQGIHSAAWSALYSPAASGAASGAGSGSAGIDTLVDLPAGGSAIFTLTGSVDEDAFGQLRVAAAVTAPADAIDTNTDDNVAADVDRRPLLVVGAEAARARNGESLPPQVQVVDAGTGAVRAGFEAFAPVALPNGRSLRPGVRAIFADLNGDGVNEILAAPTSGPVGEVRVFRLQGDGGYAEDPAWQTRPFGDGYRGGLHLAAGDFDGDGDHDLAVARDRDVSRIALLQNTGSPATGFVPLGSFTPFAAGYRGGASLVASDLTGDGRAELILGSGPRIAPVVKVFGVTGGNAVEVDSITPSAAIKGAVSVSVGRFDADAIPDIIVAGGRGSAGRVEIYDGTVNASAPNAKRSGSEGFTTPFASSATVNAAVFATGVDLDGDGRIDRFYASQGRGGAASAARAFARTGEAVTATPIVFGGESTLAAGLVDSSIVETASGLRYRDLVVGSGALPTNGQRISVHYVGSLVNGTIFDDSRSARPGRTGQPFEFTLGARQVIAGWDEGLATMRVGGRRTLIIPAALGYGASGTGSIPPNSTLVFDVELLSVT